MTTRRWFPAPLFAGGLGGARRPARKVEGGSLPQVSELLRLQSKMLEHCFRLQQHESQLSARARRKKGSAGGKAIRQVELERQRLGRELHTGVGQMLAATRLQIEIIEAQMPDPPPPVKQALERVSFLAAGALQQVRSVSRGLHPPEWQRLTLPDALQQLWDSSGIPQKYQASIRVAPLSAEPELEVKVLIYRAFQEALSNIVQHSNATAVEAILEPADDHIVLTVRDNGVGFDGERLFSEPARVGSGIGLRSIREQAAGLGGELTVQSGPGGTTLTVSAPLRPAE